MAHVRSAGVPQAGTDRLSRRSLLVGACGTCAVAVAGCSGYGAVEAPKAPAAAAAPGSKLAATADVPVGAGTILADQDVVITQPVAGTFRAFSATCTHQGCTVTIVADGTINCPCHGSKFAIADGSVVDGPATKPLPEKQITVDAGAILLN